MRRKAAIILAHGIIGWALCAATIGISFQLASQSTALIIHAVGAPIFFSFLSRNYFVKFRFTTALQTAALFLGTVLFMDFAVVALLVQRSLVMFTSPLGTWIPFGLIFVSTYLVGLWSEAGSSRKSTIQSVR